MNLASAITSLVGFHQASHSLVLGKPLTNPKYNTICTLQGSRKNCFVLEHCTTKVHYTISKHFLLFLISLIAYPRPSAQKRVCFLNLLIIFMKNCIISPEPSAQNLPIQFFSPLWILFAPNVPKF